MLNLIRQSIFSNSGILHRIISKKITRSVLANASTSSEGFVVTEKQGPVFLIGINRPEKRNCVNLETGELLLKAFKAFDSDPSSSVAVLYGKGGNFCAGFDLAEVAEGTEKHLNKFTGDSEDCFLGPSRMLTSKPVIGAISGYAVAGGMELALLCDLRVMEETAVMGVFCRRFGVPLIDGGTVRLPQLIGLSRALDLILTGRAVTAKEAETLGLANRVVECGSALGGAINLAHSIARFPQECLRADRRSAYYSTFDAKTMKDALKYEFESGKEVLKKESVKGAQNFVAGIGKHGTFKHSFTLKE